MLFWISLFVVGVIGNKFQLPSYFEKCSKSDSTCILKAFEIALVNLKNGDPKLGYPSLDPVHVDVLDVAGIANGPVSLRQKYSNVDFYGTTGSSITNMSADFSDANCHMNFQALTPQITMIGDYEMNGQILMLPLNGKGNCKNVFDGLHSVFKTKCEKYTKKGEKYIRFSSFDIKYVDVEKTHFNLSNLIEGNEKMSEELLKTLNENGKAVFNEVKSGIEQAIGLLDLTLINNFYAKFPEKELFLD